MKRYILIFISFWCSLAFSQTKYNFYFELASLSDAATVTTKSDGTLQLTTNNTSINALFQSYTIYSYYRVAPYAISASLQKTFSITCNNPALMSSLRSSYPSIYISSEPYTADELLFTPNDYYLLSNGTGGTIFQPDLTQFNPNYLDAISARDAWDITHGNSNVLIGISDNGINPLHEEFVNKNLTVLPGSTGTYPTNDHGNIVAALAAGDTNNGVGASYIGFDSGLVIGGGFSALAANGAKVINYSAGLPGSPNTTTQNLMNDLHDQGVVMVVAAGNGVSSGGPLPAGVTVNSENYASRYYYPASYKNVISVSTVGNGKVTGTPFNNWLNYHKIKATPGLTYNGTSTAVTETEVSNQHNDSVDIVVPAYRLLYPGSPPQYFCTNCYWSTPNDGIAGTSFSAPIVAGTIGLMFSVNYCLKPEEVDAILKLTATPIDTIPDNVPFQGRLGAGSLNAYKAVSMANQMALPTGSVVVSDRNINRWFLKLATSPYEIKMLNNTVTESAKLKFIARDNIEILSGDYKPSTGYVQLEINEADNTCAVPTAIASKQGGGAEINKGQLKSSILYPNPNTGDFKLKLDGYATGVINVKIFDILGKTVYDANSQSEITEIHVSNLPEGMYIVKVTSNGMTDIHKFIKE